MNHTLAANLPDCLGTTVPTGRDWSAVYVVLCGIYPSGSISGRGVLPALSRMRELPSRLNAGFSRACHGGMRRGCAFIASSPSGVQDRCARYNLASGPCHWSVQHPRSGCRSGDFGISYGGDLDRKLRLVQVELGLGRRKSARRNESGRSRPARGRALLVTCIDGADAFCRRNRSLASCHGDRAPVRSSRRDGSANRDGQGVSRVGAACSGELIGAYAP